MTDEASALPPTLRAVAWVNIIAGAGSAIGIVAEAIAGRFNANFMVLLLPAGIGLLRRSPGWRSFILFISWLLFAAVGFALPLLAMGLGEIKIGTVYHEGPGPRLIVCAGLVGVAGLCYWQYLMLHSESVVRLFASRNASDE